MNIVDYIKSLPKMRNTGAATEEEISLAEDTLGLEFAEEYKEVLRNFGAVRACGHEINAFTKTPALNVIEVTKIARQFKDIAEDLYVFESLGIDDIVMVQNKSGKVYQCVGKKITPVADSILEYLKESIIE